MFKKFIHTCIRALTEKKPIPEEVQKQMLEFFMQTSIPRRKEKRGEPLLGNEKAGDYYSNRNIPPSVDRRTSKRGFFHSGTTGKTNKLYSD